jgi:hypothetical protein
MMIHVGIFRPVPIPSRPGIGGELYYYFVSKFTRPPQDDSPPTKSFPNF